MQNTAYWEPCFCLIKFVALKVTRLGLKMWGLSMWRSQTSPKPVKDSMTLSLLRTEPSCYILKKTHTHTESQEKTRLKVGTNVYILDQKAQNSSRSQWLRDLGKGKGSPRHLVKSCPTLGHGAHPHLQVVEPAFVRRQFLWSCVQSD